MREDEYIEYPLPVIYEDEYEDEYGYEDEPVKRPPVFAANAQFFFGAVAIVISAIAINFAALSISGTGLKSMTYLISTFMELFVFAVLPLIYAARNPRTIGAFRLIKPRPSSAVLAALLSVACVLLSYVLTSLWGIAIEKWGGTLPESNMMIPDSLNDLIALIAVVGILPGICEEIMFRGMMLGAYENMGGKWAMIVTGLLFAALHASVGGFPAQLVLGLVLSMLALFTGSIYPGIVFHALYNSILLVLSYFSKNFPGADISGTIYESVGGTAGVLKLVMLLVFAASLVAVLLNALYRGGAKERVVFVKPQARERRSGSGIVLIAALITVALLFLQDIARVFGLSL